jgi:hypothetical protein
MDRFIAQMQDLYRQAINASTLGEFLRLDTYLSEARQNFWDRSGKDVDARNAMWSARFALVDDAIRDGLLSAERATPCHVELEPEGPKAENFFGISRPGHDASPSKTPKYADRVGAAEKRLGIQLPDIMRTTYAYDNGGHTEFVYQFMAGEQGMASYYSILDDYLFASSQYWTSLDAMISENRAEQQARGFCLENQWRDSITGLDRLIVLSRQDNSRTSINTYFCLDYRDTGDPAVIEVTEVEPFGGPLRVARTWTNFEDFFNRCRRAKLVEIDGVVRKRGLFIVEILDKGVWRAPFENVSADGGDAED